MYINTETASVTLTFEIFEIGLLFYTASLTNVTLTFEIGTCRLDMLNTCAILFENSSMHKESTVWTRKHVYKHRN